MMSTRNTFKYRCADCGWTGMFGLYEFARRCRPHCQECGCTMLDPVTTEAQDRIMTHDAEQIDMSLRQRQAQGFTGA